VVKENIVNDFTELLPQETSEASKQMQRNLARWTLDFAPARVLLDAVPEEVDPLVWWPCHPEFSMIYRVVKMFLQIPASSAENERSFSSASFILDERRTRLDLDNFRREHRIRRALCAGTTPEQRLQLSNELMQRFAQFLDNEEANVALIKPVFCSRLLSASAGFQTFQILVKKTR
jgi:hAT family C-terminal dimerisation region